MSLINNMLKDLESRQLREAYDQDKLMGGVKVQGVKRQKPRWLLPVIVLLIVLVLVISVLLYFSYQSRISPPSAQAIPAPVSGNPIAETISTSEIIAISNRTSEAGEQLIITLQGHAAGVVLRQSGSDTSLSLKQIQAPEKFSLSSAVLAAFPGAALNTAGDDVQILLPLARGESLKLVDGGSKDNQQLILTRSYQKPVQPVSPEKKPRPQVSQPTQPQPAPQAAKTQQKVAEVTSHDEELPVIKQRSALSAVEQAEQSYKLAYAALQEGQLQKAEKDLRQSIGLHPMPEAYLALAGILIQQGKATEARQVLKTGLQQLPGNSDIAYLYARLLVDSSQPEKAQKVLANAMNEGRNNADFLALFAAVSHQLRQNILSAQAYTEALKLKPREAVWWMGLGLALDEAKQSSQALEAYYKALAIGLGDSLDTYVMKRVKEIEGEQ